VPLLISTCCEVTLHWEVGLWKHRGRKISILEMAKIIDYTRHIQLAVCRPQLARKMPSNNIIST